MKALILAGGRGKRLNELTRNMNKSMVKIWEKPVIEYNLEQAYELGVKEIVIVVGYRKEEIIRKIGKEYNGIKIKYVVQKEQKGLVHAIETTREAIGNSDFILMLADEIVVETKLKEMIKRFREKELFAICGTVFEKEFASISKTYTAMINEKGRVFRLIEKPKVRINNIKGTGHCILRKEIFEYIPRTPINAFRNQKELVDMIQVAIDDGKNVEIFPIAKDYVNINSLDDINTAKEIIKKNNPKVLIVHNQMKFYGGAELLIVELANRLTKQGIKNDILALSSCREVQEKLIDTEVIVPENDIDLKPPGFKNINDIFKAIKVFRQKLKEIYRNYDVINFHDFPTTWALFPRKKPAVWFMNQPPGLWSKPNAGLFYKLLHQFRIRLDKFIIRKTMDEICVLDEFNKMRAEDRYSKKPRVVYCGVNYDIFSKGSMEKARKKYNLSGKFVILHSGQIGGVKNQLDSIKTINKIKDKMPNVLLILAGIVADENYKKIIDDYIKENNLEKFVMFTGNLPREELRDLYKASNLGLFPIGKQGGWLAPFEMLCAGIPVIMSSDMGSASIAKDKELCTITKDYAKAVLGIYNNPKMYKEQAEKAALFIRDNMSWKRFADRMIKAYKDAWKKHKE